MFLLPEPLRDEFSVIGSLSEGGQAKTFLVSKSQKGTPPTQQFVLKLLHDPSDATARKRFSREIEALQKLDHPNVVKPLKSDPEAAVQWLLLPKGESFEQWWLLERKSSPEGVFTDSLHVVRELLHGLTDLHKLGYVHRDIKPGNVILINKRPCLIDLGLVFRPEDADDRLTAADGRSVKNVIVEIPQAMYDLSFEAKPWWDSIGIVMLWVWMLSEDTSQLARFYHHKYHRLIKLPENAVIPFRSLMAMASDDSLVPQSAPALLETLAYYFPSQAAGGDNSTLEKQIAETAQVRALAKAKDDLEKNDRFLQAQKCSAIVASLLIGLLSKISDKLSLIKSGAKLPFTLDTLLPLSDPNHVAEVLVDFVQRERQNVLVQKVKLNKKGSAGEVTVQVFFGPCRFLDATGKKFRLADNTLLPFYFEYTLDDVAFEGPRPKFADGNPPKVRIGLTSSGKFFMGGEYITDTVASDFVCDWILHPPRWAKV
ncbi:MAG: protein kinase [Planctomycetes bacterium]|nr:protein kinase [Planctomycetota bacterium]